MEAILLIGIQGSGKSTFYRERFFDTHLRVSLDLLRTRHRERRILQVCLETNMRFVVDKTNVTAAERGHYIALARAARFKVVGYFFEPDARGAFERNQGRARPVPPAGLFGTLKRLEEPRLEEGFDRLYRVTTVPGGGFHVYEAAAVQGLASAGE
ncbi:MAG: AAA family ATPase [Gammaproteobacteria bacterium]